MRKLEYINPDGDSVVFGEGSELGITKLDGTGIPDIDIQEQRAPFQDGSTPIDQLYEPRSIDVECIIGASGSPAYYNPIKAVLCSVVNPKSGPGTLIYTNDYGSWQISALPQGPVFNNTTIVDGPQRFQIVFYCHNPYWQDVADTTVTLAGDGSYEVVNIVGDIPSPILAAIGGVSKNPRIDEIVSQSHIEYDNILDENLKISTAFGEKTVQIDHSSVFLAKYFGNIYGIASDENLLVCCVVDDGIYSSSSMDRWTKRASGTTLRSIAYNTVLKQWCAVGSNAAYVSSDGLTWNTVSLSGQLYGVDFDKVSGLWAACGTSGSVYTSTDGAAWTSRSSGSAFDLQGIHNDNGRWVAVSLYGEITTSTDGTTWSCQGVSGTGGLFGVSYSASLSQWCIVGNVSIYGGVLTSTDGTTWTKRTLTASPILYAISFVNSRWVAVGSDGILVSSTDGLSWSATASVFGAELHAVIHSTRLGSTYAVGFGSAVYTTANGASWATAFLGPDFQSSIIAHNNLSGVSIAASFGYAYKTTDNITWSKHLVDAGKVFICIVYNHKLGKWFMTGNDNIYSSSDAETWALMGLAGITFYSIAINAVTGEMCAVGHNGSIYTSLNGVAWTSQTSGTTSRLHSIARADDIGLWCACGYNFSLSQEEIFTSSDGITWTQRLVNQNAQGKAVCYAIEQGLFVTDHEYSANGVDWTASVIAAGFTADAITYSNDLKQWLAVGSSKAYSSIDGKSWTLVLTGQLFNSVVYAEDLGGYLAAPGVWFSQGTSFTNVIQYLAPESQFFSLQPGRNVLSLSSLAGAATATVTYRNRYAGR